MAENGDVRYFPYAPDYLTTSKIRANLQSHEERLREMAEAWRAYNGVYEPALTVKKGEANPNIELNFARLIVNKGVSFLFGQDVGWDIDATSNSELEKWLDRFWRANRKMFTLQKLATNGAVCGHPALKIIPPKEGEEFARLQVINPSMLTVFWEPDDFDQVQEYRLEWDYVETSPAPSGRSSVATIYRRQRHINRGLRWDIVDEQGSSALGPWRTIKETEWPFPFSAIVDTQNLPDPVEYYGAPDLEPDILRVINRLNFIVSNWNKILRHHAHPRQWGVGFEADELKVAPDETLVLPHEDAKLDLLEMKGAMTSTDRLYGHIKEALHEIARIPEVTVGKVEAIGNLSGVALSILYQPLLELTYVKRVTYGPLLEEINRRVLWISGKGQDVHVDNVWGELLPSDPKLQHELAQMQQEMGLASDETLAIELGRDWPKEKARLEAERQEKLKALDEENRINGTGRYAPQPTNSGPNSGQGARKQ
jgi:hypothetical protein